MNSDLPTVLIVGAGQAGAASAFELRAQGFQGRVVLVGAEQHLPYERPQLSKEVLKAGDLNALKLIRDLVAYQEASIELRLGVNLVRVSADEKQALLSDESVLSFDHLLIATGVSPRRLPGLDGDGVTYLRTVEDALKLRSSITSQSRIAIIGGGVIGLEVASAISAVGGHPIVIEAGSRLMARSLCERTADYLDTWHRQHGVEIKYGVTATNSKAGVLSLSDGENILVDHILVCVGVEPNTAPFIDCGITTPHGILVDEYGKTKASGIYATGDVAVHSNEGSYYRIETWEHAQQHAELVAKNILGAEEPYRQPIWFWSDQGELNLQVVGNAMIGKEIYRQGARDGAFSIFRVSDEGQLLGCTSINSPKDMALARRWIKNSVQIDHAALSDVSTDLRKCVA